MLKLEQAGYRYPGGHVGLQDVNASVIAGDLVGIVGPNGSGKSTLVRLLSGELPLLQGQIQLDGVSLGMRRSRAQRGSIRLLTQDPSLDPEMTVRELLQMFGALYGMSASATVQGTGSLLTAFGISPLASRRIAHLSGGQRQRVHICTGLLGTPRILLLDEPANNLDADGQKILWQQIERLCNDGAACLLVSHQVAQIARRCSKAWILRGGSLVASGSPAQLVADSGQEDLAGLVDTLVGPVAAEPQRPGRGAGRGRGRGRGMG